MKFIIKINLLKFKKKSLFIYFFGILSFFLIKFFIKLSKKKNLMLKFFNVFFNSIKSIMDDRFLIIVCGCTGTGKSNLGVEIAKKFNGEIISADSMQIYKGINITLTN